MQIFDSHCHLDDKSYDKDLAEVIARAHAAEVNAMMIAGIDLETSEKAIRIADAHATVFASVGVHPHDVKNCSAATLEALKGLACSSKVKAWGEIGLDFNRMYSPKQVQEKWFVRQLKAADELALPLIFHERDSNGRLIELLEQHPHPQRKAVVHCFSGNEAELQRYLEMGFYIGITGIITIKERGQELRRLVSLIPADRLLVETDAPYLTPVPYKNKTRRNEPAFVRSVLLALAEVRKQASEELADVIWNNTCCLFNVSEDLL